MRSWSQTGGQTGLLREEREILHYQLVVLLLKGDRFNTREAEAGGTAPNCYMAASTTCSPLGRHGFTHTANSEPLLHCFCPCGDASTVTPSFLDLCIVVKDTNCLSTIKNLSQPLSPPQAREFHLQAGQQMPFVNQREKAVHLEALPCTAALSTQPDTPGTTHLHLTLPVHQLPHCLRCGFRVESLQSSDGR